MKFSILFLGQEIGNKTKRRRNNDTGRSKVSHSKHFRYLSD